MVERENSVPFYSKSSLTFPVTPESECVVEERDIGHQGHDCEQGRDRDPERRVDHVFAMIGYPMSQQLANLFLCLGFLD